MKSMFLSIVFCLGVGLLGTGKLHAAAAPEVDPEADPPRPAFRRQTDAPGSAQFAMEVVAGGLQLPRSLVALPDGDFIVAEGSGRVRVLSPDGEFSQHLDGMPPVRAENNRSLRDFILDADFARNRRVYFTYAAPPRDQVVSARLSADNSAVEDLQVIAEIPGRRMVSAGDGTLYISTMGYGDARPEVQKLTTLTGKILRINSDGSIPRDNPYHGRTRVRQEIFSVGHRDPDGLALHPQTGELWEIEHGPMGGDELNVIRGGNNYGWPLVTYGKNYDGTPIGPTTRTHVEQPVYFWYPSVAPSGLMIYTGELFPHWRGSYFLGAMSPTQGRFLVRLVLGANDRVVAEDRLLVEHDRRVRDVVQGADGAVWVMTDSENNAEENRVFAGEILKLTPPR